MNVHTGSQVKCIRAPKTTSPRPTVGQTYTVSQVRARSDGSHRPQTRVSLTGFDADKWFLIGNFESADAAAGNATTVDKASILDTVAAIRGHLNDLASALNG